MISRLFRNNTFATFINDVFSAARWKEKANHGLNSGVPAGGATGKEQDQIEQIV